MITIRNRKMIVPANERHLCVEGDNNTCVREFSISRAEYDLAGLSFFVDLLYDNGQKNENIILDPITREEDMLLTWTVISNDVPNAGTVLIQLKAIDLSGLVKWKSYMEPFYIEGSIGAGEEYTGDLSAYEVLAARMEQIASSETTRETAEAARATAEELRATAEAIRISAELARQTAETLRQTNTTAVIQSANEKISDVESRFNTLTTEQQQDAEVIDARKGKASLKLKMDDIDSQLADIAKVGLNFSNDTGDARGTGAVDLQKSRTSSDQVAKSNYSFVAGGQNNQVKNVAERGALGICGHTEGINNKVQELYGHAEGANCIVDGKISHAEGNVVICTANDSHAEGNRTVAGRRYYPNITFGSEDAGGGLGVLQFVLIPDSEGDVTSYFPNALTDNVESRYRVGATKDVNGNILPPAPNNYLTWAMHPICILRGSNEPDIVFAKIAKAVYSGIGTKIYYYGNKPFTTLVGIYSSYSPVLLKGGNGVHAEGIFTSAHGYGAHAEGNFTRAWGDYTHAEGYYTKADGIYGSHSEGYETNANGAHGSHAEGYRSKATGISAHSEGYMSEASGDYGSHTEGEQTIASGSRSHAQGQETMASGQASHASGRESVASRPYQEAYSDGKITTKGDNQTSRISYTHTLAGVGWHPVNIFTVIESGKAYHFETMVLGRQTAGTTELVGNTFAYKFNGCFIRNSDGTYTVLGTPTRTLVGRSAGMSGDGLATGVRVSWSAKFYNNAVMLQYDGVADTTFSVTTYSTVQEMGL